MPSWARKNSSIPSKSPVNNHPDAKIVVQDLHKRFGVTEALRGVSLTVQPGEVAVIIGPSGSGKTTLLRCINFLVEPDAGVVLVDGRPVGQYVDASGKVVRLPASETHRLRAKMPMVFQRFNLFQNRTVLGNVMEGQVVVLKRPRDIAEAKAVDVLKKVGLGDKLKSYPSNLSGGQQQRVGIARALAMDPEIILFDEPTSSLDPEKCGEVLDIIRQLASEGMTMIVGTHEMGFARQTADRIYFVSEGLVAEEGPPDQIFTNPKNPATRALIDAILH